MSRIVLENVTARFGKTVAVNNLSLEIPDGSFFALLGPSGCGKTTTMRLIAGLERPDSGKIWIGDRLVNDAETNLFVPPSQRGVGMVFQNYALWPHMTVRENIIFGLKVRGVDEAQRSQRYDAVVQRLQIEEFGERYPNELSGGQQQRVALARELIAGSRVLLMDEPLSNLDAKLRVDMRVELKQLHQETGGTIIYVTHDQIEALTLSSLMSVMREGLLQQLASPNQVFAVPRTMFVASFMASAPVNQFRARLHNGRLKGAELDIPIPEQYAGAERDGGLEVVVVARPEELSIESARSEWSVEGRVSSVLPMGYSALVRVDLSKDAHVIVERDQRHGEVAVGDAVFVRLHHETMHVFDATTEQRLGAVEPFPEAVA